MTNIVLCLWGSPPVPFHVLVEWEGPSSPGRYLLQPRALTHRVPWAGSAGAGELQILHPMVFLLNNSDVKNSQVLYRWFLVAFLRIMLSGSTAAVPSLLQLCVQRQGCFPSAWAQPPPSWGVFGPTEPLSLAGIV